MIMQVQSVQHLNVNFLFTPVEMARKNRMTIKKGKFLKTILSILLSSALAEVSCIITV